MRIIYQALMLIISMSCLCGLAYPILIGAIAHLAWADKAQGSLVKIGEQTVGSSLIAQSFKKPEFFWPRPSASDYNTLPSVASNLGPTSKNLKTQIDLRKSQFAQSHQVEPNNIPIDMLTASASGLDPHISLASAKLQIKRVAKARGLNSEQETKLKLLIEREALEDKNSLVSDGLVNILLLNLILLDNKY